MTYTYCKKIITNKMLETTESEKLAEFKEDMQLKVDVFLLNNRITQENYNELTGMLNDGLMDNE